MLRRSIATGIVALGLLSASGADLTACGDKFLRAGRSARQKNYAAAYPASILILKSATSTPEGLEYWRKILKQAGHATPVVVDGPGLSTAIAGARFDVVLADYSEVGRVDAALAQTGSRPGLLPVLHQSGAALTAEARRQYHCVILAKKMDAAQAMAEIDHLMELRRKGTSGARAD